MDSDSNSEDTLRFHAPLQGAAYLPAHAEGYPSRQHHAVWADAQLDEDGTLILQNAQVLFHADSADAAAKAEPKGFDSQPRRDLNLMPKEASGS